MHLVSPAIDETDPDAIELAEAYMAKSDYAPALRMSPADESAAYRWQTAL